MFATFERFELEMTRAQAQAAAHQGQCDADVAALTKHWRIAKQLDQIGTEPIRDELREYGAWDDEELSDDGQNRHRIVWIAATNINEGN